MADTFDEPFFGSEDVRLLPRLSGYLTVPELVLLSGLLETDLRSEMRCLGIQPQLRFGTQVLIEDDARRLMVGEMEVRRGVSTQADFLPGFKLSRLHELMRRAIDEIELNLSGMVILTEAATGAYATTAVLAAMAGAKRVYAFARASRFGSIAEAEALTFQLASFGGVAERITVVDELREDVLGRVDLVTNSGHLRPLSAHLIEKLPSRAAIALMFEAWEFRPEDIDLEACIRRNIPVVGVNERHPAIDVFSFLGLLCVRQLQDCGLAVYRDRIALLCDNEFAGPLFKGLAAAGAMVTPFSNAGELTTGDWDAVVVALRPGDTPRIGPTEARLIAANVPPNAILVQFWGDVDRSALREFGIDVWPLSPPRAGHMGILLSDIGPEPIVRLQAGGLRAAEWILRGGAVSPDGFAQLVGVHAGSGARMTSSGVPASRPLDPPLSGQEG